MNKRVLILGGGHAGVSCARALMRLRRREDPLEVTLVSREPVEVWHGLMPQVISGSLHAQDVLIPLREILPGVRLTIAEVESIDLEHRRVTLGGEDEGDQLVLEGDHLVLALGSVTDLSRFPGLSEHGLQTKTIADFIALRNHLIRMLEAASLQDDPGERERLLTFVVAGAGFAGVEIASEVNEFVRGALRHFPASSPSEVRVINLDILTRILPTFSDRLADRAARRLRARGVELKLGVGLKEATASGVVLSDGQRIATRTIIATAGIGVNPLLRSLPVELERGRIRCDATGQVQRWPGVYAAGDNASIPGPSGTPAPAMLMVAFTQGELVARNILAKIRGRQTRPYRLRTLGEVALLSKGFGLAQLKGLPIAGWAAAAVSQALFLSYMPSSRRRLALFAHWLIGGLFPNDLTPLPLTRSNLVMPMRFAAGDVIVREGEAARRFYVVREGEVEVVQQHEGSEVRVARLGPGGSFGELALLGDRMRAATVRAVTDTTVLSIARADFGALVEQVPALRGAWQRGARTPEEGR